MESKKIKCPQCGLLSIYSLDNPSRPFCSDRCKLIDLGEWASESYKIEKPLDINDLAELDAELNDEEPT